MPNEAIRWFKRNFELSLKFELTMFEFTVSDLCYDHLRKNYRELQFEHWSYLLSYKIENTSHNVRVFFSFRPEGIQILE